MGGEGETGLRELTDYLDDCNTWRVAQPGEFVRARIHAVHGDQAGPASAIKWGDTGLSSKAPIHQFASSTNPLRSSFPQIKIVQRHHHQRMADLFLRNQPGNFGNGDERRRQILALVKIHGML